MHFHLPKPLHGWREFVGEVGIIVVGVLIALGAEQIVESFRWQEKVRSTEESIRRDLALTADVASERVAVRRCLDDRLDRLKGLIEHPGAHVALAPNEGGFPMSRAYRAPARVWNSQPWDGMLADGTLQHLDPERARALNLLYLTVRSAERANQEETAEAPDLWILDDKALQLTPDKRVDLLQRIASLSRLNGELYGLSRTILRRIADLGELPPLDATIPRLASQYSLAVRCKYARADLQDRVSKGWFTLHR
jgi:hypothetical protein